MFVTALELPQGMDQDALAHQDLEVLLHCFRLAWQVDYQSLTLGADDCPGETCRRNHFNGLLNHVHHKRVSSLVDNLKGSLRRVISFVESGATGGEYQIAVKHPLQGLLDGFFSVIHDNLFGDLEEVRERFAALTHRLPAQVPCWVLASCSSVADGNQTYFEIGIAFWLLRDF